jgi:hypothetical protein
MENRSQVIIGAILVALGLMLLVGRLIDVDLSQFCWPVGLIVLGALVLLRPRMLPPDTEYTVRPFGDIRRRDGWRVRDEEIWMLFGDVHLDFRNADLRAGDTVIRIYGLIGDVDLLTPQDVAVQVSAGAFVTDMDAPGKHEDGFLASMVWRNAAYDEERTERRLRIEVSMFIADLDVTEA